MTYFTPSSLTQTRSLQFSAISCQPRADIVSVFCFPNDSIGGRVANFIKFLSNQSNIFLQISLKLLRVQFGSRVQLAIMNEIGYFKTEQNLPKYLSHYAIIQKRVLYKSTFWTKIGILTQCVCSNLNDQGDQNCRLLRYQCYYELVGFQRDNQVCLEVLVHALKGQQCWFPGWLNSQLHSSRRTWEQHLIRLHLTP